MPLPYSALRWGCKVTCVECTIIRISELKRRNHQDQVIPVTQIFSPAPSHGQKRGMGGQGSAQDSRIGLTKVKNWNMENQELGTQNQQEPDKEWS